MQSSEQERVAKARKVEASFSYRMATRRQYLIRWKMFSTKCIRPGKHPVVLGVNGAGVAQAAGRARRGEAALPAWSLAKAPRVRVAARQTLPKESPKGGRGRGHQTTMIYLHLLDRPGAGAPNPLDL
jgi:hypothetical protein